MRGVILLLLITLNTGALAFELPSLPKKDSVGLLLALARTKVRSEPLTSIKLADRAIDYAKASGFERGEGDGLLVKARAHYVLHQNNESLRAYEEAAKLFNEIGDDEYEGLCYNGIAGVYIYSLLNYPKGYFYCSKARKLLRDSANLQTVSGNIASLHILTNKYDDALEVYSQVARYWQRHNNLPSLAIALNNIATAYEKKNDFHRSVEYYEKALEINRQLNSVKSAPHVMLGLASSYCHLGEHRKAEEMLRRIIDSVDRPFENARALQFLAEEQVHLDNNKLALKYSIEASDMIEKYHLTELNAQMYKQLGELHQKNGELSQALEYQRKYAALQDSTNSVERAMMAEMVNEDIPERKSGLNAILLVASALVVVICVGLLWMKRSKPPVDEQRIQTLEVITGEGERIIEINSAVWFDKDGKNTIVSVGEETYRVRQTINELEGILPKEKFFKINRAVIVNMGHIHNYSFWEHHKYIVRMNDERKTEFVITRKRLHELKEVWRG